MKVLITCCVLILGINVIIGCASTQRQANHTVATSSPALNKDDLWLYENLVKVMQEFNLHPDKDEIQIAMDHLAEAESFPMLKLASIYKDTPDSQKFILKAARNLAKEGHWSALAYAHHYKNLPNGKAILELAVKNAPNHRFSSSDILLKYFESYRDLPNSSRILEETLNRLLSKDWAETVLENIDKYIDQPYAERIIEAAAVSHIGAAFRAVYPYNNSDKKKIIFKKLFEEMQERDIDWLFWYFGSNSPNKYSWPELIKELAITDPGAALSNYERYSSFPDADQIIQKAVEDCLQKFPGKALEHHWGYKKFPDYEVLLRTAAKNSAENDPISALKEIEVYIEKPYAEKTIKAAIKKLKQLSNQEEIDKALSTFSLRVIVILNRRHNQPDNQRFSIIKTFNAELLYLLMVYGEEEMYTSTFNGLLDRFLKELKQENLDGYQFLQGVNYNRFRTFFKLNASFNRLNDFLKTMPEKLSRELLGKLVKNIEESSDPLSEVITIAETLNAMQDSMTLQSLRKMIKSEYERLVKEDKKGLVILYGFLASMLTDNVWAEKILEKYKLQITEIPSSDLFNAQNVNIQQYLFYDDKDGLSSFTHFLSQYHNDPAWQIYEYDTYVLIESISNNKRKIKIYANKPGKLEKAKSIFLGKNIVPTILVHRGHSYHLWQTLEEVTPKTKLAVLGSCGGYNAINEILRKSLSAHVLSTKGLGSMYINDPLLNLLNEEIIMKGGIHWPNFWKKAEKKLGGKNDFKNYIPPHENLGLLIRIAYQHYTEQN